MYKFLKLLIMFGFIAKLFSACTSFTGGYSIEDNNVYWNGGLNSAGRHQVPNADAKTFKELNTTHGIDAKNAFYKSFLIQNADRNSFQALDGIYSKDKNTAYFESFPIQGSDVATFTLRNEKEVNGRNIVYAFDKNYVYYQHVILSNDPQNYQYLSITNDISKDKAHVYCHGKIIDMADAATFEALKFERYNYRINYNIPYFKDKNHVYFAESTHISLVHGANPKTFALITKENTSTLYAKDDKHIYLNNTLANSVDINSFELLEGKDYFRDKHFYYILITT